MGQLENMQMFVRIVEAGSISRAAEQMGVVKSVVSRRLVELETQLGTQLIQRTTRQSNLTESGRHYYERALQILADVTELNALTANSQAALSGNIKVAVPLSFGLLHLAPAIIEFAEQHQDLVVNLDFSDRQVDLIEEGFDLAIRIAELGDANLVARKLSPIRALLCASPTYLATKGMPNNPNELKDHQVLCYTNMLNSALEFTGPNGDIISVRPPATMIANNGDFLCKAAVAGLGIVLLPTFLVAKEIEQGCLIKVLDNYKLIEVNAYAVYPQTRYLSYRVRALIDFLAERFSGEPYWDKKGV